MFKNIISKIIFATLLALVLINPTVTIAQTVGTTTGTIPTYSGVDSSLTTYLCTPDPTGTDSQVLAKCINKLYRFGISFGAIALVFFLVFAGYMYITGGETGKSKAKGILQNALIGVGLLLGSYVLLSFINPSLVIYKPIQPPIFNAAAPPSCQDLGLGNANCEIPDGEGGQTTNSAGKGTAASCAGGLVAIPAGLLHNTSSTICKDLADKLVQVAKIDPPTGVNAWTISQTWSSSTPSVSRCHHALGWVSPSGVKATETGNCADLIMVGQKSLGECGGTGGSPCASSDKSYANLCKAVKQVGGLNYLNEASSDADCAPFDSTTHRTGANLHTNFIGT